MLHHEKMKAMRTRGKKKNERHEKLLIRGTSRPDLSSLHKPMDTSVSDLHQVNKLLENGTDEVKSILSCECNIIYECRICHSLFRSIINFVSHKREYCEEKFNITRHRRVFNDYNMDSVRESIIHMYKTKQTSNDSVKNDRILRSQVHKETNKKDLTEIIDMLNKKRKEDVKKQLENKNAVSNTSDERHIYLEAIDTNCSAVYQTIKPSDTVDNTLDLMKEQITELHNMKNNILTLEEQTSENQLEKSDSPIQANMSDEENELLIHRLPRNDLSCSICNVKFSTKKTLTVHIKTLHAIKRLCYPCPCCENIFANTWSVYRHLFKVHKKTNQQVRKLRPQIQEKAFHRKTTAMKDIENVCTTNLKNITENSDKTQEPINCTESNTNFSSKHGKRLSRKIPLSTYLQYCQTPIAACNEKTIKINQCNNISVSTSDNICESDMCEIEDTNLTANSIIKLSHDKNISSKNYEHILSSPKICDQEMTFRVQNVSSLNKKDWDMLENQNSYLSESNSVDNNNDPDITSSQNIDNNKSMSLTENLDNFVPDENLKSADIVHTGTNKISYIVSKMKNKKEKKMTNDHTEKQLTNLKERDKIEIDEDNSTLQSSCLISSEKTPVSLMENKIAAIANFRKLRCLLCKRKFTSVNNLRRHIAMHIGWNRYRCKLCNFKCFVKCDCIAHCNKVHNMQNNRTAIAEMVLKIPEDEYTCNEDVTTETVSKIKSNNSDITDITVSSCQSEIHADSNDSNNLNMHIILQSEIIATNEQNAESRGSIEHFNVDAVDSDETVRMQDSLEDMMNGRKLDNPELKRMIMEVIFGSIDTNAIEQADSDKLALESSDAHGRTDANDNVNNSVIDESREKACSILDNIKYQRPTRNRIRPLSEDFIYDLKKVSHRKESAFIDDSEILHIQKKAKLY